MTKKNSPAALLRLRRLFAVCLLSFLIFPALYFQPAQAQATVDVTDLRLSYHFGERISMQARLSAPAPISSVSILFRAQGESSTRSDPVTVQPDGQIDYQYTFAQGPLRPFARVDFWFHVTLQTGEQLDSASFYFYYNDDRFPWRMLEDGDVRVHWYAGDDVFARQALDAARVGMQKTGPMLSVLPGHTLDLYIYAITADLQTALEIGGESWSGGHASPDLGVGLVAIAPGLEQGAEMDRKIPHELAHLLTYEVVGQRYDALPVWLREGIASMAEAPNPDYPRAISLAVAQQSLIPIADLCGAFPPEMSRVTLAYAESEAFTRFIVTTYGNSGLLNLMHAYADGLDCQQGPARALGNPLGEIESEWWRSMPSGVNNGAAALESLFPYLAILALTLLVPLAFVAAVWRMPLGPTEPSAKK
jgi:hypothetical protein